MSSHVETSQRANQLTNFYMTVTLVGKGLNYYKLLSKHDYVVCRKMQIK